MGSVAAQGIPEVVKKEIKDLLSPFFTRDYDDGVRNPILLLNFLHQHSVISKPVYDIRADPNKPFHFICSCSVEPLSSENGVVSCAVPALKVEADAGSKRECKNKAAQKILDILLIENKLRATDAASAETTNLTKEKRDVDVEMPASSPAAALDEEFDLDTIAGLQLATYSCWTASKTDNFYEDDLTGIMRFDDLVVNAATASRKKKRKKRRAKTASTTNAEPMVVEPQGPGEGATNSTIDETSSRNEQLPGPSSISEGSSAKVQPNCQGPGCAIDDVTLKELSSASMLGKWLSEDRPVSKSRRTSSGARSRKSRKAAAKKGSSSSSSSLSSSSRSSASSASSRGQKAPPLTDETFENFFDPFSKLRPKIVGYLNPCHRERAMVPANETTTTREGGDAPAKFVPELVQNNKTPFQILQEKAVKYFKLIPRSRIDKKDDGFECTLVLDSRTGRGEGRTKKEAKVNAALNVLRQLDDLITKSI